jgi:basic membrane protein A and related proteins
LKKMKILFKIFMVLALLIALAVPSLAASTPYRVAMVTDIGGLGDKSFNDAAYDGLKLLQKNLGADIKVVESKKMEDYVPNLKSLADQKYDMIWAIGFLMADATKEVAAMYPNQKFGIIDSEVKSPNVVSVSFKEQEGSFLVGVIAATDSKKAKVGFIGGMEFPLIKKFEAGFKAGVLAVNHKATVYSAYTGAFDNPDKGKELASAQFAYGADIVYHASGACGLGVIAAAKEKGDGYWAMGVDKCQHAEGVVNGKDHVLACMVKRVDVGVFTATNSAYKGHFGGGSVLELGLKEDGVGVCDNAKRTASAKALAAVEKFKKEIIAGKLVVPIDPKAVK